LPYLFISISILFLASPFTPGDIAKDTGVTGIPLQLL